MSIHLVEYLLRGNTKWNTFFANHKKRDDLADSLLMTLHYLEKPHLAKLVKKLKKVDNSKAGEKKKGKKKDADEDVEDNIDDIDEELNLD